MMNSRSKYYRNAFTSTELIVACSILVVAMSAIAMLSMRTTRLWKDSRDQQVALDELCKEIDRLTALPADARYEALDALNPSIALRNISPDVALTASWSDEKETAIILRVDWNTDLPKPPVELIGWINPTADGESK